MIGPFLDHARCLIDAGYSPLPIRPGGKRPLPEEWETSRTTAITEDEIEHVATVCPDAGLGVAGGFNDLVPIDLDTDDREIRAAIRKVLPKTPVAKKGKRGATAFFRGKVSACKLKTAEGKMLVEVLSTGQTVIPPTLHPETGKPYVWTSERTLLNTPISELPEITEAHMEALRKALAPWLPPPKVWTPKTGNGAVRPPDSRVRAYAEGALADEARELAAMGKDTGRNRRLFDAGCKIGSFVHHGVLASAEVENALLGACNANGLMKEDGPRACRESLMSGLRKAEGDELKLPPGDGLNGHHPPTPGNDTNATAQVLEKASRIYLVPFEDIKLGKQRRYSIKGLIPRVGLTVIWGAPKCGKSFLAFDMAMHVALGWEYRGRRVHQGPVVYCAFEGQTGIEARAEAWRQKHLAEEAGPIPFYLEPVTINLVKEQQELIETIKRQLGGENPVLVVLDTLNRSLQGSESSDEDMSAYVRATDAIRDAFNCAVAIVHHCGHDGNRPRGHSALIGAADAIIGVRKESAGQIIAKVDMMKDGAQGEEFASRLECVTVGIDSDGDEITSCVVLQIDVPVREPSAPKLTPNQQTMLTVLQGAKRVLPLEEWNTRAKEAGLGIKRKADLTDFREALRTKGFVFEGMNGWSIKK